MRDLCQTLNPHQTTVPLNIILTIELKQNYSNIQDVLNIETVNIVDLTKLT